MSSRPAPDEMACEAAPTAGQGGAIAFAALLLGSMLLAFGPWFVRLADVGPVASGFWRLTLALPMLAPIAATVDRGRARPGGMLIALLAVGGLCFALDLASWHAGILRTRLANATLFGNVGSFFFAAYGFAMARRWPTAFQAIAIGLAVAGVVLLMGRSYELSRVHLVGDLLCMAAGLAYTGYMVAVERVRGRLGTWTILLVATLAAAAVLLPIAWALGEPIVPHDWTPLVALALGSQVLGQGLIVYAIGRLAPMVVGLGLLTQPIVAAAIGWAAYGERLTPPDLAGAAMIAAALMLIRRT